MSLVRAHAGRAQPARGLPRERAHLGARLAGLRPQHRCGLEVVADELVEVELPLHGDPLQASGRGLVERCAAPLGHAAVRGVVDEGVRERECLLAEQGHVGRPQEIAAHELVHGVAHVTPDEVCHGADREGRTADGRRIEHLALLPREPVEPGCDEGLNGVRHAARRLVERCSQELLEEQRVALGHRDDALAFAALEPGALDEPVQQPRRLVCGQRAEHERAAVHLPARPTRPGVEQIGPGETQDEDGRTPDVDDVLYEVEQGRRRPVHVLEQEDDGSCAGQLLEQAPHGPRRLLDGPCCPRRAERGRNASGDELALRLVRHEGMQAFHRASPYRCHDLAERGVRRVAAVHVAAAHDHGRL